MRTCTICESLIAVKSIGTVSPYDELASRLKALRFPAGRRPRFSKRVRVARGLSGK